VNRDIKSYHGVGKIMDKRPLIMVSLCAVVLLVMGSLSNVVGYQTVQTSQQNLIEERINQRELLFQTICDIANNKEIQRIILKSQMNKGIFPTSDIPVLTENQLKQMYFIGMILSKVISKSRMQSMVQKFQLIHPNIQAGINGVLEKDAILKDEITQLKNSECDCENENAMNWSFPILCIIIFPLFWFSYFLLPFWDPYRDTLIGFFILGIYLIGYVLNCYWI
jgi:hypothetical protein